MAEFRLSAKMTQVQIVESKTPASKNGSGMMIGPAPRSKLIAMKAALYLGTSNMFFTLPISRFMMFIFLV
jgi:hypothetical protein